MKLRKLSKSVYLKLLNELLIFFSNFEHKIHYSLTVYETWTELVWRNPYKMAHFCL